MLLWCLLIDDYYCCTLHILISYHTTAVAIIANRILFSVLSWLTHQAAGQRLPTSAPPPGCSTNNPSYIYSLVAATTLASTPFSVSPCLLLLLLSSSSCVTAGCCCLPSLPLLRTNTTPAQTASGSNRTANSETLLAAVYRSLQQFILPFLIVIGRSRSVSSWVRSTYGTFYVAAQQISQETRTDSGEPSSRDDRLFRLASRAVCTHSLYSRAHSTLLVE